MHPFTKYSNLKVSVPPFIQILYPFPNSYILENKISFLYNQQYKKYKKMKHRFGDSPNPRMRKILWTEPEKHHRPQNDGLLLSVLPISEQATRKPELRLVSEQKVV